MALGKEVVEEVLEGATKKRFRDGFNKEALSTLKGAAGDFMEGMSANRSSILGRGAMWGLGGAAVGATTSAIQGEDAWDGAGRGFMLGGAAGLGTGAMRAGLGGEGAFRKVNGKRAGMGELYSNFSGRAMGRHDYTVGDAIRNLRTDSETARAAILKNRGGAGGGATTGARTAGRNANKQRADNIAKARKVKPETVQKRQAKQTANAVAAKPHVGETRSPRWDKRYVGNRPYQSNPINMSNRILQREGVMGAISPFNLSSDDILNRHIPFSGNIELRNMRDIKAINPVYNRKPFGSK